MQDGFDIIDDDFIRGSSLDNGRFTMGAVGYNTIYIPDCRYMPGDVSRRLIDFERQNGQLFYNIAIASPAVRLDPQVKDLRTSKRVTYDGDIIYIIYNEGFARTETDVTFNESLTTYELDPVSGCIYRSSDRVSLSLESGEGKIFYFTAKKFETVPRRCAGEIISAIDSFTAKRLRRFTLTAEGIHSAELDEAPRSISAGDWREVFGDNFSGDVLYETETGFPDEDCILDLGEVKYTAEVFIDGISLGVRYMSPYIYYIPAGVRKSKLSVRVSNTAANEYVTHDAYAMFTPAQIGPYHTRNLKFEEDSMSSGLFGPVTIRHIITN
jgi:hypothetical protein